jgi:hypothetical protein
VNLSGNRSSSSVFLGASVPLYDARVRAARVMQAQADIDNANVMLVRRQNETVRQIVLADNAPRTSLSAYSASGELSKAAQTTFDAALAAYHNGVGSITDLNIASTQLLQAKNASTDAYSTALSVATRASNKTSNKASNTKLAERSKALICMIEFERKFGTGALHPLQRNFNGLARNFRSHSDKEGDAPSTTIRRHHLVGTQPADVFDENLKHLRLPDPQGLQIAVGNAVANDLDDQQIAEDSASAQRFSSRFD